MSNYQRLISYIYAYEGGIKGKNIGFAKLETRGAQCRLTVSVKRIYVGGNPIGVYLLSGDKELRIGTLFARNGAGEFRTVVNTQDVEGSGHSIEECYGLTIHDTESAWRCYTTIWEDAVAHAAEVELEEVTAEKMGQKNDVRNGAEHDSQEIQGKMTSEEFPISREIEAEVEREELEQLGILRIKEKNTECSAEPELMAGRTGAEPGSRAEAELESEKAEKPGWKPELGIESEPGPEPEIESEAEPGLTLEIESETELGPELELEAEPEPKTKLGPGPELEMKSKAEPEPELESESEPESEPELKLESELEPEVKPELEMESKSELESEPEPEQESEPGPGSGEEPEAGPETGSEPAPEWESLSGMEAAPAPSPAASNPVQDPAAENDSRRRFKVVSKEKPLTSSIPSPFRKEEEAKSEEETWAVLRDRYPKILAFDYEDGCEILTIKPQDIGLLPRENWIYGSNSFLLHGYYYYRYLILARLNQPGGRDRYLLGVPGHYVSNEKYMASMFGFSDFVLSKKQPPKDSRFGYWYTDIKMSQ